MRRALSFLAGVAVAAGTACTTGTDDPSWGEPEVGPAEGGGAPGAFGRAREAASGIAWTSPENGAADAYFRDPIRVGFVRPEEAVSFEVTAEGGTPVAGTTSLEEGGRVGVFWPDGPLLADTGHVVTVSWSGGAATFAFRTSAWGLPLEAGATPIGTYVLPWESLDVAAPASFAEVLGEDGALLLSFAPSNTTGALDALVARADGGASPVQDACTPTAWWTAADFSGAPFVTYEEESGLLPSASGLLRIARLRIEGTFAADGSALGEIRLSGLIDLRSAAIDDVAGACDREAEEGGAGCLPCPADGAPSCLVLQATFGLAERADLWVEERPEERVAADPDCLPSSG